MLRFKIFNLSKEKASPSQIDQSGKILKWGSNNSFPHNTIESIYNSGTASACMDTFIDFLEGDGISQPELSTFKINKTQTLDDLHAQVCPDFSYLEAFAIAVKYNPLGEKIELKHLPIECVRLGKPDDYGYINKIYYNPYYGTKDYKEGGNTTVYDVYNPDPEIIARQYNEQGEHYNGQVYFFGIEKPLNRFYPEPYFIGGKKWFIIDHKISTFHERNIDNNFLLSVLFKIIGDPDEAVETDKDGNVTKTKGELFDEMMEDDFSGAENAGKVLALWAKVKDEFPEIQAFPNSTNHDLFLALQQLTIDNICIATKIPPILANIQVAGKLGNSTEIVNSIKLMQQRVNKKQRAIERAYAELLRGFKDAPIMNPIIKNLNPVDVIPPEVWSSLTKDEQRRYISTNFDIQLNGM